MSLLVGFHGLLVAKPLMANVTFPWQRSSVYQIVSVQLGSCPKCFVACFVGADVRFATSVGQLMSVQSLFGLSPIGTVAAGVRLFICVGPLQVHLQQLSVAKGLPTQLTHNGLIHVLGLLVALELQLHNELFVAYST